MDKIMDSIAGFAVATILIIALFFIWLLEGTETAKPEIGEAVCFTVDE